MKAEYLCEPIWPWTGETNFFPPDTDCDSVSLVVVAIVSVVVVAVVVVEDETSLYVPPTRDVPVRLVVAVGQWQRPTMNQARGQALQLALAGRRRTIYPPGDVLLEEQNEEVYVRDHVGKAVQERLRRRAARRAQKAKVHTVEREAWVPLQKQDLSF